MGNSPLPLADRLIGHMEALSQLPLGQSLFPAARADEAAQPFFVHIHHLLKKVYFPQDKKATDQW